MYRIVIKRVFSADVHLWIESICLSFESKEFHIVGAAKELERSPNVFVRSLGYVEFYCQKKSVIFWGACRLE